MSPLGAVRLLLADDHAIVREGVKGILRPPRFEVVAEASDGAQAVSLACRHRPDVALLDVEMPELDGLEAARRIMAEGLPTQCVLFTHLAKESLLIEAMSAGMAGYLLKEASSNEIRERVLLAAAGEPGFSPHYYEALKNRMRASRPLHSPGRTPDTPLTAQEEEVLRLLAQGLSNETIAQALGVQISTVRSHLRHLYAKLGTATRAAAILWELGRWEP